VARCLGLNLGLLENWTGRATFSRAVNVGIR